MTFEELKELISLFNASHLESMKVEFENTKLDLKKEAKAVAVPVIETATMPMPVVEQTEPARPVPKAGNEVKAPLVGVFYDRRNPESEPFVKVGDRVKKGDPLCIIEAMKVMNEIASPQDGVIQEVLVENEALVEFDQPLFIIG